MGTWNGFIEKRLYAMIAQLWDPVPQVGSNGMFQRWGWAACEFVSVASSAVIHRPIVSNEFCGD